jgi:phosphate transport system substrate-binding protein
LKQILFIWLIIGCILPALTSCENKPSEASEYISDKDTFTILCDPSWESIIRSFIVTYDGLNAHQSIKLLVKPESECIQELLTNNHSTVFVSRSFTKEERTFLESNQWTIEDDTLCYDGLAWIVPRSFPKDSITVKEIQELFERGTFQGQLYSIQLNSTGSSIANYLSAYFGVPPSVKHIYTGGTDEEILNRITQSNQSIACISSSWLVNLEEPKHRSYLSAVKLLKIISPKDQKAYFPFQNDLALGMYPFKRVLRVLNHDARSGLGTAFASFLMHERGQRAFLKAGLLPYKIPGREVEFKTQ